MRRAGVSVFVQLVAGERRGPHSCFGSPTRGPEQDDHLASGFPHSLEYKLKTESLPLQSKDGQGCPELTQGTT